MTNLIKFMKTFLCKHPRDTYVSISGGCIEPTIHWYCKKYGTLFVDPWVYDNHIKDTEYIKQEYSQYFDKYNIIRIVKDKD